MINDSTYLCPAHAKFGSNVFLRNTLAGKLPDLLNKCGEQLGVAIAIAARPLLSVFSDFVVGIINVSAEKQVIGVAASSIVASMQDAHARRYRAIMKLIGIAMRRNSMTVYAHSSIAAVNLVTLPFPAFIWATPIDVSPKPLFGRALVSINSILVRMDKAKRLASDNSMFGAVVFREWRRLTTAALAEFDRGKFHIELLWGMILHVTRSFQRLTMPRAACNSAAALLLEDFILAQMSDCRKRRHNRGK